MAAESNGEEAMESQNISPNICVVDRLKRLYPNVNENETPLPRSWSSKDKYTYIGLSQSNLRVHYKGTGHGKTHKDAASVRATHPIPAACGLYYFEVRIVSKGRDGYMGIGLSASGVNMNRLPGWDKHSYGYHGDDGNSFCSSGTGQTYGPTFTTGDVIGCGVNLVDNTCFYTKNGHDLGIAFRDLPPNLYPTVGLQTPGEVVDANFGQSPFVFDIEDMLQALRARTRVAINEYITPQASEWQDILHKMVSSYLVHHGYCSTAEAFAQSTGQAFDEEVTSIKTRQRILKLVLAGRMGEAIESTIRHYPGLLERNPDLLFMLKCRQFIEMVNGSDSEVCPTRMGRGSSFPIVPPSLVRPLSPRSPSPVQTSVIQSTKNYNTTKSRNGTTVEELNQNNLNGSGPPFKVNSPVSNSNNDDSDVEMDGTNGHGVLSNGSNTNSTTNGYQNGNQVSQNGVQNGTTKPVIPPRIIESTIEDDGEDMGLWQPHFTLLSSERTEISDNGGVVGLRQVCGGHKGGVERMLEFGRELSQLSHKLQRDNPTASRHNQKMLEDAFSLLAYSNPWASPLGWQLSPSRREPVCAALNSAILESMDLPWSPPLEVATSHAWNLLQLMAKTGLGSCAFASVEELLDQSRH
ncbi:ran-binding protein 9 isoform X3 [Ctenocephalides felis]|uniref:ran-binding protein 9 isoform X3 n=1 Tax=Ctenocephalides felis TaxID=7515 RepID=UPI000E6E2F7D|nr:ran-binding protein 9 isoform X3 [Ctenocephalides felis]